MFHPGEFIADEINARGWSMDTAEKQIGLQRKLIEELIVGARPITRLVALCLSDAFGVDSQTWLNLQKRFDEMPKHAESGEGD